LEGALITLMTKEKKSCILCLLTKNKDGAAVFLFAADERKGRAELLSITLMTKEKKTCILVAR
jgi:hypothetical protein